VKKAQKKVFNFSTVDGKDTIDEPIYKMKKKAK